LIASKKEQKRRKKKEKTVRSTSTPLGFEPAAIVLQPDVLPKASIGYAKVLQ
jgi:hypothetical protein